MTSATSTERSTAERLGLAVIACVLLNCGVLAHSARAASAMQELDATRRRPLFAPTRRPPPEPAAAEPVDPVQPAPTETRPSIEVRGIILGNNHRVAIVKRPSSPQTVDVAVGSDIDGWIVAEILPRGIVLRRNDRAITLSMPEPGH